MIMKYILKALEISLFFGACFGFYVMGVIAFGTLTEHHFEDEISLGTHKDLPIFCRINMECRFFWFGRRIRFFL